jgi:hypothetical protein
MNLQTISNDIKELEKCLKIIEKTENYMHFNKSKLIFDICDEINVLREKSERQTKLLINLKN